MKWHLKRFAPYFEQSTDPTVIVIPGQTGDPNPQPPQPDNLSLLVGQLTANLQVLTEKLNKLEAEMENVQASERYTREDISQVFRELMETREQVAEQLDQLQQEQQEEQQQEEQQQEEQAAETPPGIPEIPPQVEQGTPQEPEQKSSFWNLKNWL